MSSVYAIPVLDRWLLHAPLDGLTALVNHAAVISLGRGEPVEGLGLPQADEAAELQPRQGAIDPQFLGLIPTRVCNLRCAYCGFGASEAHSGKMGLRMAAAAVDWMAGRVSALGRQVLDVHFFGGEPLSAPDVVEVAVHRTRAVAAAGGLSPRLEISTNGVCDERWARWLGDYFDCVVLSFDGPREIHDLHRPMSPTRGSFDQVARSARILASATAHVCLRVCVTEANVRRLAETVRWFCDEFSPSSIDFETIQVTPESRSAGLSPPDPYEFALEYWKARKEAGSRGVEAIYSPAQTSTPRLSFCPVGNDALVVSPNGRVSACYLLEKDWAARGLDLNIGRIESDGRMSLDDSAVERARRLTAEKPRCERCFCRWSCAGGCHVSHRWAGDPPRYDDYCLQTRLITAGELLNSIGCESVARDLLQDREATMCLNALTSDRLEDWEAAGG
jgi:uncharacterized protein